MLTEKKEWFWGWREERARWGLMKVGDEMSLVGFERRKP